MPSLAKQPTYSYSYSKRPIVDEYTMRPVSGYTNKYGATLVDTYQQTAKKPKTTFSYVKNVTTGGSNAASDLIAKMNEQIRLAQEQAKNAEADNLARGQALLAQAQPANAGLLSMMPTYEPETRWIVDQMLPVNPGSRGGGRPGWVSTTGIGGRTTADIKNNPKYKQYVQTYGNTGPVGSFVFAPKGKSAWGSSELGYGQTQTERAQTRQDMRNKRYDTAKKIVDKAIPGMPMTSAQRAALDVMVEVQGEGARDIVLLDQLSKIEKRDADMDARAKTTDQRQQLINIRSKESDAKKLQTLINLGIKGTEAAMKLEQYNANKGNVQAFNAELEGLTPEVKAEAIQMVPALYKGVTPRSIIDGAMARASAKDAKIRWETEEKPRLDAAIRDERTEAGRISKINDGIAKAENRLGVLSSVLAELEKPEVAEINKDRIADIKLGIVGVTASINDWKRRLGGGQPAQQQQITPEDQQAIDWANANPNDPRAAQIKAKFGM